MSSLSRVPPMLLMALVLSDAAHPSRPWISKEPAMVLDLQCRVPWEPRQCLNNEDCKVANRLGIGFGDSTCNQNVYAFYVLSPGHQRLDSTGLKNRSMAEADNSTEQNGPVLSIRMPVTKEDVGQFFCIIHYGPISVCIPFSVKVGESFLDGPHEQWNGSFFVRSSRADKVTVTWSILTDKADSKTIDIKIDRVHLGVDKDGKGTTYTTNLVSTHNGKVHKESGTLLAKVSPDQSNNNYTVSIFVQREFCFPNCSYQCRSSLATCTILDGNVGCCDGMKEPQFTTILPQFTCDYLGYILGVGLVYTLTLFIVLLILCLHHYGKLCGRTFIKQTICCKKGPAVDKRKVSAPEGEELLPHGNQSRKKDGAEGALPENPDQAVPQPEHSKTNGSEAGSFAEAVTNAPGKQQKGQPQQNVDPAAHDKLTSGNANRVDPFERRTVAASADTEPHYGDVDVNEPKTLVT